MDVFVYSRQALAAARPHEVPHVVISITSDASDVASLPSNTMCRAVLRLAFPDADAPSERFPEDVLFSKEQALEIWEFLHRHGAEVERVVLHCDAGMSRSPAVGAAVARVMNGSDEEFFAGRYRPNMRVYRLLLETAEHLAP